MTVEIISRSISTKVWDRTGIELSTPGSAVRHASVAWHVTDCATRSGKKKFDYEKIFFLQNGIILNGFYMCTDSAFFDHSFWWISPILVGGISIAYCHFLYQSAGYYVIPSNQKLHLSVRPSICMSVRQRIISTLCWEHFLTNFLQTCYESWYWEGVSWDCRWVNFGK